MIAGLFLLIMVGGIGLGIAAAVRKSSGATPGDTAPGAARQLVVFALLFALVVIAAVGVSGLLGRVLDAGTELAGTDVTGLARSLAFTLIAGPLAALLWWYLWKGIDDESERSSTIWPLYLAGMSITALITATVSLLVAITELIGGDWRPRILATGVVWAGVWGWHRWMSFHPTKSPTRLTDLAIVSGSVYGLAVMTGGAITTLTSLLDAALDAVTLAGGAGTPWWEFTMQAAIWTVAGAVIWWWHWTHDDGRTLTTGLADTALVIAGVVATATAALAGAGLVVFSVLSLAFGLADSTRQNLEALPFGIAALAIGGLAWAYHRPLAVSRSDATREATHLTMSGLGLITAASGIGVIVNSILDSFTTDLAGTDLRLELLMGGLSSLVVGGPVWWLAWQPTRVAAATSTTGRRLYLVAVFGVGAVVALITLLVIGYRVFEFLLDGVVVGSLVDRVRAPLGLLVATGLVAGYHYPVWKREREAVSANLPQRRTVDHVILVTGSDPAPLRHVIEQATGAAITVWMRSDVNGTGPSPEHLSLALEGVTGKRVMVVTGPGARVEVITLTS
ncbi:MAG: DUF5671 domain-containing protein [Acidimicrobiia bacterium]